LTRKSPKDTTFYGRVLAHEEQRALESARLVEGLDEDIALARTKLRAAAGQLPENAALVFKGLDTMARLHTARHRIAVRTADDLAESVAGVLKLFDPDDAPT
jgi:hypothetical protein